MPSTESLDQRDEPLEVLDLELTSTAEVQSDADLKDWRSQVVWWRVGLMLAMHVAVLYGLLLLPSAVWQTNVFAACIYVVSGLGITAGAHRLWSHRSYHASLPLRIVLAACNCAALQNSIYVWARDHRVHHKYSETNADPYNAKRGFFFSHMGWMMVKDHHSVTTKSSQLPLHDLLKDPVVAAQLRFYTPAALLLGIALPTFVPVVLWGESLSNAFFICFVLRNMVLQHCAWCVNSVAHMRGLRPYDSSMHASEHLSVALCALGEGFHNFHHTFPQDYATSEFGSRLNPTTRFIDAAVWLGLASNCHRTSEKVIQTRMQRTGDGSDGVFNLAAKRKDVHVHKDL